ncbi:hypothetical protein J6590_089321 [Homalodisca vitripennis]|nr:hypothetical protein J6590_089321 [Homalodisca vitripennis]
MITIRQSERLILDSLLTSLKQGTQHGSLLVYTFQLNPPLGTERHITNHKCRDSGVHGQSHDTSTLLWEMTVGVGGVCSLNSEVLASLNKGVPPPAFDWRGWFRAGLPFFRGDMILRCSALIFPHGSR